jgi:serine protease
LTAHLFEESFVKGKTFRAPALNALACATLIALAPASFAQSVDTDTIDARINLSVLEESVSYDRFIVKFKDDSEQYRNPNARERALGAATRGKGFALGHARRLAVGADLVQTSRKLKAQDAEALMRDIASDPNVEYVEPDAIMTIALTPNDTRYNEQWHYFEATGGLNLPLAWDIGTGVGSVVAVLDTGVAPHSDLDGNLVAGYDFISDAAAARDGNGRDSNPRDEGDWTSGECGPASSSSWHGTHVAGTVGAVTNNAKGVAGVAFGARISPVRVLGKCGGSLSDIADAIVWASGGSVSGIPANANPAEVINMSLGGGGACGTTYQAAIDSAVSRGTIVVVAAGNENQNVSNSRPANCNNVIAVAATDRNGARASFSNFGTGIDVSAPGVGILSTRNAGSTTPTTENYTLLSGTSMAAPHVAGVVALMQAASAKTPAQVESTLKSTARALPGACSGGCGAGIVNAKAAMDATIGGGGGGGGTVLQNGVALTNQSGATGTELSYTMVVPSGASNLSFASSGGTGDADLYVRFGSAPTTTTYDCRPFLSGNSETCNITTAQAGTYHVMLRGFSAFSGVSLVGSYTAGTTQPSFFENQANFNIPDLGTVESPISVSRSGNAPSTLKVGVTITHTYRGDLVINLIAPDGTAYLLKSSSGSDGADNVIATYTVNASSEVASGTWKLRVQDVFSGDTGFIDKWSLQF